MQIKNFTQTLSMLIVAFTFTAAGQIWGMEKNEKASTFAVVPHYESKGMQYFEYYHLYKRDKAPQKAIKEDFTKFDGNNLPFSISKGKTVYISSKILPQSSPSDSPYSLNDKGYAFLGTADLKNKTFEPETGITLNENACPALLKIIEWVTAKEDNKEAAMQELKKIVEEENKKKIEEENKKKIEEENKKFTSPYHP